MSKINGRDALKEIAPDEAPLVDEYEIGDEAHIAKDVTQVDGQAYVDTVRGVFVASNGNELTMRPLRALILERVVNSTAGKPKVPQIEVLIGGRHKRLEDNPNDEDYLQKLAEWSQKKNTDLMFYLLTAGVSGSPPEDFVAEYSTYFPEAGDLEMKYYWVVSLVPDDDLELFSEALMGQSTLTKKGLEEAAANFP